MGLRLIRPSMPTRDPVGAPGPAIVANMTETIEVGQLEQALAIIDRGLGELQRRELISSAEVADLLLDVRTMLTFVPAEPAAVN